MKPQKINRDRLDARPDVSHWDRLRRQYLQRMRFAVGSVSHPRLLELALQEAEALAWQTPVPELVFPTLAEEKVGQAIHWMEQQRKLRATPSPFSLAA